MAKTKTTTISQVFLNNSKTPTAVTKTVEAVVIDNQLVPDPREMNPGVVITKAP